MEKNIILNKRIIGAISENYLEERICSKTYERPRIDLKQHNCSFSICPCVQIRYPQCSEVGTPFWIKNELILNGD